ncbi:MAG: polymer-forming cytoskeletal protein [Candidatus Manganitrophus sp.]|nr:polymer-forming cytoskeletal protein [Candidatus Manganitrophus sp.]
MIGSVSTPNLIIEEGVSFNGKCQMGHEEPALAEVRPLQAVGHQSNGS